MNSAHIVSRAYRAPEVILTERDYWQALDIWSFGCLSTELLNCIDQYRPNRKLEPNE
jgi:mitogen-activated protein kinase 1/3